MKLAARRTVVFFLVLAGLTLIGCQQREVTADEHWILDDAHWLSADEIEQMDGRELIGFFDLTDEVSGEQYQVFLLFDSHSRGGMSFTMAPYNLTAFYSTNGRGWQSDLIASGTRIYGISDIYDDDTLIHLQLQPYYVAYSGFDHPLREEIHRPIHAILSMRDGRPLLEYLGN